MADTTTGHEAQQGQAVIVDDGRLPEEQPETPWDISHGVRMSASSLEAIKHHREVSEQGHEIIVRHDVGQTREVEAQIGSQILRLAMADLPSDQPLSLTLKRIVATMTSRDFAKRLSESTIAGLDEPDLAINDQPHA